MPVQWIARKPGGRRLARGAGKFRGGASLGVRERALTTRVRYIPRSMAEGRIKGAAFREFVRFYATKYRGEALDATLARLPEALKASLNTEDAALGILTSQWYVASDVHALLDAIIAELDPFEQRKLADEGASAVMQATLQGVYKVLFSWMATPERYAAHAHRLWSRYYDCGSFEVEMQTPLKAVCTVSEWTTHHPFMCLLNRGAAEEIYTAMGCENVSTRRTACVGQGASECCFVTTWTK